MPLATQIKIFRQVMIAPSVPMTSSGSLETTLSPLTVAVNAFLLTLAANTVRDVRRDVAPIGKYGSHLLVSYTILYDKMVEP